MTETTTARTWTLDIPPGTPILSANHRMHWAAVQRRIKLLHAVAITVAKQQHLPQLEHANFVVEYLPPPRLKRDRHPLASDRIEDSENLQPTAKALVDGLVRAGVLPNDSRKYVGHVTCVLLPETHPRGLVRVVITEVTNG